MKTNPVSDQRKTKQQLIDELDQLRQQNSEQAQKLAQSNAQLQLTNQLIDASSHAVITTDPDGKITYCNSHAESLYGSSCENMIGRSVTELIPTDKTDIQHHTLLASLKNGESWECNIKFPKSDGKEITAYIKDTPSIDRDGNILDFFMGSEAIAARAFTGHSSGRCFGCDTNT